MAENPQEIVRSWNLQANWKGGRTVLNKLVPTPFSKISTNFVQTWREENIGNLDWGKRNFSIVVPEGIRCISAAYLEFPITGKVRKYPGLYCIKEFRIRSMGSVVYECDYAQFIADHCESMQEQKLKQFAEVYLGGSADSTNSETRTVKLPLLLPNSTYMRRSSNSTAGNGVIGLFLGGNKLEFEVDMYDSLAPGLTSGDADPASIAGNVKIMYHCVHVQPQLRARYEDLRGAYSAVIRRFTQLSSGWTHYQTPNALVTDALSKPAATCTEVTLYQSTLKRINNELLDTFVSTSTFQCRLSIC